MLNFFQINKKAERITNWKNIHNDMKQVNELRNISERQITEVTLSVK